MLSKLISKVDNKTLQKREK